MFERFRSWLRPDRPTQTPPAVETPATSDVESQIAERLLEDESLRGDLDDDTWQPLQDAMLKLAHGYVSQLSPQVDAAAAVDEGHAALRQLGQCLVAAIESGQASTADASEQDRLGEILVSTVVGLPGSAAVLNRVRSITTELAQQKIDSTTAAQAMNEALVAAMAPSQENSESRS
jgi:hypothetical protein